MRILDVSGVLERAGADIEAAEGSQAHALAEVDATFVLLRRTLAASMHALRSYQHGNCEAALAEEVADAAEAALRRVGGAP
ncbi:hypothetical protein ABE488_09050 [Luteimonas sp. TWI662]|uniref:hypothetical protein n=1 Tax=Luteimonas sp. TWI662 TaxID=3136789 RepID=UPI003209CC69